MKVYYNTNHLTGLELAHAQDFAGSQEDKVLNFFRFYPGDYYTAEVINEAVLPGAHRGTVSRALRNLTIRGLLEKTENYGKSKGSVKVHTWRLARAKGQQQLF